MQRLPAPQRTHYSEQATQPIHARAGRSAMPAYPVPQSKSQPKALPKPRAKSGLRAWMLVLAAAVLILTTMCGALTLGAGVVFSSGVLPGVSAGGIALGGLSETEAAAKLQAQWKTITLRDGTREWQINPADLGITLDAAKTAQLAYRQGRGAGSLFPALFGKLDVAPAVNVDLDTAQAALTDQAAQFAVAPLNAGVELVNGKVQPTAARNGRTLDMAGTLSRLQNGAFSNGALELAMQTVSPAITDSSGMVAQAQQLLTSFLDIRVYDPITGDSVYWSVPPDQWAKWLTSAPNPDTPTGLSLTVDSQPVSDFLNAQAASIFDPSRYLKIDEGVTSVQQAIANGQTNPVLRVYHHDTQHIVQPGETIISIAWDVGEPYPWIQAANNGIQEVSVGQSITIPSPDNFLQFPPVPDKRIVVSISQQKAWIYENNTVKWEWTVSTGISSSPTWPGIYQIISHEPNAYAANWNLYMPHFMGVYQPIPGSDFTNGFHGFPTRGGGQLLWENDLGTRVTYGCILLSNENAATLYDWAQEGVVVEIKA